MPKSDLTDITIILDRSGSMASVRDDTIGGFNTFLDGQKSAPGDAKLTLVQFDHEYEFVHNGVPIADVPSLTPETYLPRGNTALRDAIGRSINEAGARFAKMPESDRPGKVLIVIITDGEENASKEFTHAQINSLIKTQRETYSWEFIFIGANQDAIATGASIGILNANSLSYASNATGTRSAMASLTRVTSSYRGGASLSFDDSDRDAQKKAGASH